MLQGMPYSSVKLTGVPNAQCLQGILYSPVKFTWAPDAQCLQGMPYSPVKFTGAPDVQCLIAGDVVFPGEVQWGTRYPMFARIRMPSPTNYPASCYAVYYV